MAARLLFEGVTKRRVGRDRSFELTIDRWMFRITEEMIPFVGFASRESIVTCVEKKSAAMNSSVNKPLVWMMASLLSPLL